jgi:hypothetical protein
MNDTPRPVPPNFVPTLTEVVQPGAAHSQPSFSTPFSANPPMALPAEFANLLQGWPEGPNTSPSAAQATVALDASGLTPAMLERILLRVELSLASRMQATVESVVESHMRSCKAALTAQISEAVLDAVKLAVIQETAAPHVDSFQP